MVKKQSAQDDVSTELVELINSICPLEAPAELWQEQHHGVSSKRATIPSAGQEVKKSSNATTKLATQQTQDSAMGLQQLRSRERAQLEKLRQLQQRRRSQQLEDEQKHLDELYSSSANDFSTANSVNAGGSAGTAVEPTQQLHQKMPTAQSTLTKRQATPTRKQSPHQLKPVVTAERSSPSSAAAPLQPVPATTSAAQKPAANTQSDVAPDTAYMQPSSPAVAAMTTTPDAACKGSGQKQRRRLSVSPAVRNTTSPAPARATSSSPAAALRHPADSNAKNVYDKPWRANMKVPAQQQAVAIVAGTTGNAAERAAAQLLAAAADTGKPVVLRSKKRTPEEQAQLKEFMKRQQQQQVQLQREEKKQQAEAAARRTKVLKEIAAQQREAARQHQQQLSTGGTTGWQPEQPWKGVLTPSPQASHTSLLEDFTSDIPQQQLQQPEHQQQHLQQLEAYSNHRQQSAPQYIMQQLPGVLQQQQQQPYPGTLAWEHQQQLLQSQLDLQQQPQQRVNAYEAAVVPDGQANISSSGTRDTGGGSKQHKSPTRGSIGGSKRSRDVSPGKVYLQEKQALIAANNMARREYDERLRARAAVISKAAAATSPANHSVGYAAAISPAYGSYTMQKAVSRSPIKGHKSPSTAAAAAATNALKEAGRSRKSSKRGSPTSAAKVRRGHRKSTAATTAAAAEADLRRSTAKKQRQQQVLSVTDQDVAGAVQAAEIYGGDKNRMASLVRDQQSPAGAIAAATPESQSALASFWAQQHVADTRHAGNNALIQEILHKSNLLKSRIEHICSKALHQQAQQKAQQQQQPELQQSPPRILADQLYGLLDKEQQVVSGLTQQQRQLQHDLNAMMKQHAQVGVAISDDDDHDDGEADGAAALTRDSSKLQQQPWHQKLRSQLLEGDTELGMQQQEDDADLQQRHKPFHSNSSSHSRGHQGSGSAAGGHLGLLLSGLKESEVDTDAEVEALRRLQQQQQLAGLQQLVADNKNSDDEYQRYSSSRDAELATSATEVAYGNAYSRSQQDRHNAGNSTDDDEADALPSAPMLVNLDQLVSNAPAAEPDITQYPLRSSSSAAATVVSSPHTRGDLTARLRESLNRSREVPEDHSGTPGDHQPGSTDQHVVTWYSGLGGLSPGVEDCVAPSPEPASPDKEEDRAGLRLPWQILVGANVAGARASLVSRSISGGDRDAHWQQQQQGLEGDSEAQVGVEGSAMRHMPRWSERPAWAAAGLTSGYRWDVMSSSSESTSDDEGSTTAAAYSCEQLVREHEALQQQQQRQQQQLICMSNRDLGVARNPKYQVEQASREMQQWLTAADEQDDQQHDHEPDHDHEDEDGDDLEAERNLFSKPVRGDPNSIINTFLRMHTERMQRLKQQQQQARQQQQIQQQQQFQQQQQQQDEPQALQSIAVACNVSDGAGDSYRQNDDPLEQPQQLDSKLASMVNKSDSQQQTFELRNSQPFIAEQQQQQQQQVDRTSALEQRLAQVEELLQRQRDLLGRAVSPTQMTLGIGAQQESDSVAEGHHHQQEQQRWDLPTQQQAGVNTTTEDSERDWLEHFMQQKQALLQQQLEDKAGAGESAARQQQQQRRRMLSPDTLQRMHEQNLAKLETAQEAEVDLLMLQQAQELVLLQQEAARVARDLDQQQFLALVQQQQQAAAHEQIEHSAGLFQRVTKGLLDETFGQLKEVSAMFASQMRDSNRRSFGVQADDEAAGVDFAAATLTSDKGASMHLAAVDLINQRQQQQRVLQQTYSQDGFEEPVEDSQPGAVDSAAYDTGLNAVNQYTAVLPEDGVHPVLHFHALLKAQQTAAASAADRGLGAEASQLESDAVEEEEEALMLSNVENSYSRRHQQQQNSGGYPVSDALPEILVMPEELPAAADSDSIKSDMPAESLSADTGIHALTNSSTTTAAASVAAVDDSAALIAEELAAQSAVEVTDVGLDILSESHVAAASNVVSVTEGQQYGSSSFESYKDIGEHISGNSMMGAQCNRQLLQEQLSAAEHELSALSLHIDAIMVGYAVQALQAAKNKTKQAAIHRQALEEQQQKAAEKQKLMDRIQQLKQQLGISHTATAESSQTLNVSDDHQVAEAAVNMAASAAAASFLAAATAAVTPQQQHASAMREPFSSVTEDEAANAAVSADADNDVDADAASLIEDFGVQQQRHSASPVSLVPEEDIPETAVAAVEGIAAAAAAASGSSVSEVDYSDDFHDVTSQGISKMQAASPQTLQYGSEAAASPGPAAGSSKSRQSSDVLHKAVEESPSSSLDSLQQRQQEVAALQRLVEREYEKQKLEQQQQALQQLLLQFRTGDASAAAAVVAGTQLLQLHRMSTEDAVPAASAAAATSLSATAVVTSESATSEAADVTDAEIIYSDDFVASAVEQTEDLHVESSTSSLQQQRQQQQATISADAAMTEGAFIDADEDDTDVVATGDGTGHVDRQLSAALSVLQPLDQLIMSGDIEINVLADEEQLPPPAAAAATAAAAMVASMQGYSESGFCSEAGASTVAATTQAEPELLELAADSQQAPAAAVVASESMQGYTYSSFHSQVSSATPNNTGAVIVATASTTAAVVTDAAEAAGTVATAAVVREGSYELSASEVLDELLPDDVELEFSAEQSTTFAAAAAATRTVVAADSTAEEQKLPAGEYGARQHGPDEQQQQQQPPGTLKDFANAVEADLRRMLSTSVAADDDGDAVAAGGNASNSQQEQQYTFDFSSIAEMDVAASSSSIATGTTAAAAAAPMTAESTASVVDPAAHIDQIDNDLDPGTDGAADHHDDGGDHDEDHDLCTAAGSLSPGTDAAGKQVADAVVIQQQPSMDPYAASMAAAARAEADVDKETAAADDIAAAESMEAESVVDEDVISQIDSMRSDSEDAYELLLLQEQQRQQQQQADDNARMDSQQAESEEMLPVATAAATAVEASMPAVAAPAAATSAAAAAQFGSSRSGVLSSSGGSGVLSMRPTRRSSMGDGGGDMMSVRGEGSRCMSTVESAEFEYSDWEVGQRELSGFIVCESLGTAAAAAATEVERSDVEQYTDADDAVVALEDAMRTAVDAEHVEEQCVLADYQQQQQQQEEEGGQQEHSSVAVTEAAAEDTETYSLDFNSISMQVSEVTAAAAVDASDTATANAGVPHAVAADLSDSSSGSSSHSSSDSSTTSSSSSSCNRSSHEGVQQTQHPSAAAVVKEAKSPDSLADLISAATFDAVLTEVLQEAALLCSPVKQPQPPPPQQQQQQQQVDSNASSGTESVETADTADSSGSHSIQPDWQSTPGSGSPYSSPLGLRMSAAAATAAGSGKAELVSHPPTDWTPLAEDGDSVTPWSVVNATAAVDTTASTEHALESVLYAAAAAAAESNAAATAAAASETGLSGTVMQLDALLAEVADEGAQAAEQQDASSNAAACLQQQQQQQEEEDTHLSLTMLGGAEQLGMEALVVGDSLPPETAADSSSSGEVWVFEPASSEQQQQHQQQQHMQVLIDDVDQATLQLGSSSAQAVESIAPSVAAAAAEGLADEHDISSKSSDSAPAAADGGDRPLLASARSSTAAGAADDDEFDWPETSTVVDATGSETAEQQQQVAAAAAAPPAYILRRRTPSPPPLLVDDSPQHVTEYVRAIMTMPGLTVRLPDVLPPNAEPLQLEGYLWLEKEGHPEWSRLADGSDSDERHIFHKALYDATHQAILQVYAEANRLQGHPCCDAVASSHGRIMKPLGSADQLLSAVTDKVVGWSKQRIRDEAGLDRLLAADAQEEDKSWQNVQQEVAEIALEVAAGIWDDLLTDTAEILAAM